MTPKATIDDVFSWNPCEEYTREKIAKLFGRKKSLTAMDILALKIPIKEKFWAVLRNHFLDDKALRLFTADCAEHVLHFFEDKYPDDKRPREAIEAARKYARGEIDDAAWTAVKTAARAAAGAAARAAAGAAAWDAARAAAWDAARAAAGAAARAAAGAKEEKWQVGRLKAYLKGEVKA
jgi:hypothetical protein